RRRGDTVGGRMAATGVLLAGGQSRRMKTNKALLDWQGEPLIAFQARRFQAWFSETILITNTPSEYAFLGLPMYSDRIPGLGPLVGIEAALGASRFPLAFVAACDMPFIDEALVRYMVELAAGDYDAVVPRIGRQREPLHAVYGKACLPHIAELLDQGTYAVAPLFS